MIWKLLRVHEGLDFVWTALNLDKGEDCWFGFNEVNIIPLQLQINFTELREDICGLWQPKDTVSMTPFDSHLLCAATGVQTLLVIIRVHHIA